MEQELTLQLVADIVTIGFAQETVDLAAHVAGTADGCVDGRVADCLNILGLSANEDNSRNNDAQEPISGHCVA